MSFLVSVRTFTVIITFGLFLLAVIPDASAECNDSAVKQMLGKGKTVASIARTCKMSKEDVLSIQDELNDEDEPPDRLGFPSGAPVGQCGCWGYVNPEYRQPHPQCRSGNSKPKICNTMCPGGGFAWREVCT